MRCAIVYRKAPNTFGANTLKLDYDTPTCGEWHRRSLKILRVLGYFLGIAARGGVCHEIGRMFQEKGALVSARDKRSLEELGRWLLERCLKLRELLGRQRTDSAWKTVEQAKAFIAEHYADCDLSVESMCAHLHLSATYFSALFKRETGQSFTACVTEQRMNEAARLLRDTEEKTYLIAQRTGYADPNYFSYVFKRHFGVTPSKYRAGQT